MMGYGDWSGMMGGWGWPLAAAGGALLIVAVIAVVFWLWMLIDCLQRSDKNFPAKGANDKLVWVVVLLLTNILGAILYYLLVRSRK